MYSVQNNGRMVINLQVFPHSEFRRLICELQADGAGGQMFLVITHDPPAKAPQLCTTYATCTIHLWGALGESGHEYHSMGT
jgi:hypothetical protein